MRPGIRPWAPLRGSLFWTLMLALAAAAGWFGGGGRLERAYLDQIAAHQGRPAPEDIVIVAIDDDSLQALGRWPWPRSVHAALLDRLDAAGARAVGLDLILSEPRLDAPRDDALLREAIVRHGRVVLPVHMVQQGGAPLAVPPAPELERAAAALGHIHFELDPDGVARRLFLREDGWDHFVLALLAVGGEWDAPPGLPARNRPDGEPLQARWAAHGWSRGELMRVPYAGPPGHFRRLSYVDVLEGRVGAEALAGRYVLVGATAVGLGDAYPTPMADRDGLMPGVEISANVLDALRRGVTLRRASPAENALLGMAWMALALLALRRLEPRWALGAVLGLAAALHAFTWLAQAHWGLQFASLGVLGCVALSHPLWSWQRLRAAVAYLDAELLHARAQAGLALLAPAAPAGGDALERRMEALAQAAGQLRELQRFVRDSLDALPDAMLVTDPGGALLLANRAAARALGRDAAALRGRPVAEALRAAWTAADGTPLPDLLQLPPDEPFECRIRDAQGRDLLLKCVPRSPLAAAPAGWILSIVDISTVQQAQRQREEALRFISHDMRSPQASILALLELQRLRDGAPDAALLDRIEAHVRRTLALADSFMQLARAQSDEYRFEPLELADVVFDAADQHWDRAAALGVELRSTVPGQEAVVRGDRTLLTRAVANLIDNALKYGPGGGGVSCTLEATPRHWRIAVHDNGPGIPAPDQARLFEPFTRLASSRGQVGLGLGLAFVHAVALKHGGAVAIDSGAGRGTTFALLLPRAVPQNAPAPPAARRAPAPAAPEAGVCENLSTRW